MEGLLRVVISVSAGLVAGTTLMAIDLPNWTVSLSAGVVSCLVSVWLADKGW